MLKLLNLLLLSLLILSPFAQAQITEPTTYIYGPDVEFNQIRVWPATEPNSPIMLWVPGGGWAVPNPIGEPENPPAILEFWRDKGWAVATMIYRPTFEPGGDVNPFPVPEIDTARCISWIRDNAVSFNVDVNRVFAHGRSAGAYNLKTVCFYPGNHARPDGVMFSAMAGASLPALDQTTPNAIADHFAPLNGYYQQSLQNLSLDFQLQWSPLAWILLHPEVYTDKPIVLVTGNSPNPAMELWGPPWAPNFISGFDHNPIHGYWTKQYLDLNRSLALMNPVPLVDNLGGPYQIELVNQTFFDELVAFGLVAGN